MDIELGHDEDLIGFGDLALIFKIIAELNRSNLTVFGGGTSAFSETILVSKKKILNDFIVCEKNLV